MLQLIRLLSASPILAMHPEIGEQMMIAALQVLSREREFSKSDFSVEAARPVLHAVTNASGRVTGKVMAYPIMGALSSEDQYCGPKGYDGIANDIRMMARDGSIDAVMLDIKSPGGQVTGLENVSDAIAELRAEKPVVAFVNGMAASAAYRIAIETDSIIMSGKTSEVGSIGVMLSYYDLTEYLKREGVREVKIISSLSPDKNKHKFTGDQTDEDVLAIQKDMLDPLAREFQAAVKKMRPGISEDAIKGNMYLSKDAIKLKMADRMGSYSDAINYASYLARQRKSGAGGPSATNETEDMGIFSRKVELVEVDSSEMDARIQALTEQYTAEIETLTTAHAQELATVRAEASAAAAEVARLTAIETELRTRVATLSAQPVNKVADADGNEGVAKEDELNKVTQEVPAYVGLGIEESNKQLRQLGLL